MQIDLAKKMIALNNHFYQQVATFFHQTRNTSWAGWELLPLPKNNDRVLDVAAGNCRLAHFLHTKGLSFDYLALDNSQELLAAGQLSGEKQNFLVIDLLQALADERDWRSILPEKKYDYIFCSAFLHHIPLALWREKLLETLFSLLAQKGFLIVTFWQFMNDPNLAKRVKEDLGENDYILDWKKGLSANRYCHHFSDEEIDKLWRPFFSPKQASLVADFKADGSTHRLNHYLVWQKK